MRIQNIHFVPRYSEAAASSRLRVFTLARELERQSLAKCSIGPDFGAADAIVYQKLDPNMVRFHPRAIYDFDDIASSEALATVSPLVQIFTVDSDGHGALAPKRWELLPDPIDYQPIKPLRQPDGSGLVWFGNYPNFESARPLFESASQYADLSTITDKIVSQKASFLPWNHDAFPGRLRGFSAAFLSHRGADPGKSANKMIAAVTLGVPCIVNESPAYEALARAVGLDWSIVRAPAELKVAWERLQDTTERQSYLEAIQPYVWEHYRAEVVARRFMQIVESLA